MQVGTKCHRYTKTGVKTSNNLSGVFPVASVFFGVETNFFLNLVCIHSIYLFANESPILWFYKSWQVKNSAL